MRTCRLLLLSMMRRALLAGFARTPPVFDQPQDMQAFAECTATLYQLQAEVQASVPQHIGYLSAVRQRARYSGVYPTSPVTINADNNTPSPSSSSSSTSSPPSSSSSSSSPTSSAGSDAPFTRKTMITRLGLLAFPWADFASSPTDDQNDWELASTHLPLVRSYGSSVLLWTLFLVGNQELTTRTTQKWAAETCAHIGEAMGLRQANVLADILKEKMEMEAREGVVRGEG